MKSLQDGLFFLLGFSFSIFGFSFFYFGVSKDDLRPRFDLQTIKRFGKSFLNLSESVFDDSVAKSLFDEVKVVCMVVTQPINHKSRAIHVKNTWGKRCNKLLFFSSASNDSLDVVALNITESREALWAKTIEAFKFVYENHFNDYDWFVKADDDSYFVIENLRQMLYQYDPNDSLYFGHRYTKLSFPDGYMAGGGYILSKRAVEIFVKDLLPSETGGFDGRSETGSEDFNIGICLLNHAVFVDCRDDEKQKRFFPVGIETHLWGREDMGYWFFQDIYYNTTQGNLNCCSDKLVQMHYISPQELYGIDYFIYHVQPFGFETNEDLPVKLTLDEVIARSNVESVRRKFKEAGQSK